MNTACARVASARIGRAAGTAADGTRGHERGQGLVEAALTLGIAVVVATIAIVVFGPQLAAILDFIGAQVQQ